MSLRWMCQVTRKDAIRHDKNKGNLSGKKRRVNQVMSQVTIWACTEKIKKITI